MAKDPKEPVIRSNLRPDWERNGMTEAAWNGLTEDARIWRRKHPSTVPHAVPPAPGAPPGNVARAVSRDAAAAIAAAKARPVLPGGQEVLSGDAARAARGELHGTIEHNTAARDRASE